MIKVKSVTQTGKSAGSNPLDEFSKDCNRHVMRGTLWVAPDAESVCMLTQVDYDKWAMITVGYRTAVGDGLVGNRYSDSHRTSDVAQQFREYRPLRADAVVTLQNMGVV